MTSPKIENINYMYYIPKDETMVIYTSQMFNNECIIKYKCSYKTFCEKYLDYAKAKFK
jgi:hypothetical protein